MFTRDTEYNDNEEYLQDCMIEMLDRSEIDTKAQKAFTDRNFSYYFAAISVEERPAELMRISNSLSDQEFWRIFRTLWANSDHSNTASLLAALNCGRDNSHFMMYEDEIDFLNNLPEELIIYRGGARASATNGWSWTIDESVAHKFAVKYRSDNDGAILRGTCCKKQVLAFLNFRGLTESEILIDPKNLTINGKRQAYFADIEQHDGTPSFEPYSE